MPARPADTWSPQYFLAALGYGGLAVTFFLWLYMWVPHPGQPVPVFEDIAAAWSKGNPVSQTMIFAAMAGLGLFGLLHLRSMIWNLGQYAAFRRSPAHETLRNSNGGSQLFGLPLMLAMTVNVSFSMGLAFVPGLWSLIEYLFPAALLTFALLAVMTLRMAGAHIARLSVPGRFDWSKNGSFAQVQPAFALGMIGVGMSAAAALSANPAVAGVALILSTILLILAALWAAVGVALGLAALLQHGAAVDGIPTLMNIVPLMAVLGILMLRQNHGLHSHFGSHTAPGDDLWLLTALLSVQLAFLGLGLSVARNHGYLRRFVTGAETSAGSYGLVCPGVGLAVILQFWINKGLVGAGLLAKFSAAYWAVSGLAMAAQLAMIALVILLNRKHFSAPRAAAVTTG